MGARYSFALPSASADLAPGALKTTQQTSKSGICSTKLSIVPPAPISISSECAPRQRTRRANPSETFSITTKKSVLLPCSRGHAFEEGNLLNDDPSYFETSRRGRRRGVAY